MLPLLLSKFCYIFLLTSAFIIFLYVGRSIYFSLYLLFIRTNNIYEMIEPALDDLPTATILIPAHNEGLVIKDCLESMVRLDYPSNKLTILVINDRSCDNTKDIIETFVKNNQTCKKIKILNRYNGDIPGKAAALNDAIKLVKSEIIIIFDSDYMPMPNLAKKLVIPFIDPEVGATMGKVVAYNSNTNILTRLIDLERKSGYTIDMNMRNKLNLFTQFGGTTGAIRLSALKKIGGWESNSLTEDTDLSVRMHLHGFKIKYLDHAACYEEVPENWYTRYKQVKRWAYGHNQCLFKYFFAIIFQKNKNFLYKLDAILILFIYMLPAITILNILLLLIYQISSDQILPMWNYYLIILALFSNFGMATYAQMVVACILDQQIRLIKFLPFIFISSIINMIAVCHALFELLENKLLGQKAIWNKTTRFRTLDVITPTYYNNYEK